MAHLWFERCGSWEMFPLVGERHGLTGEELRVEPQRRPDPGGQPFIFRGGSENVPSWAVLAPAGTDVRVNGMAIPGIRVLEDRDQIAFAGHTFFFSAEIPVEIVPFPGTGHVMRCPRCRLGMDLDHPAVRCPGCGVWHHQSESYPCWTYAPTCAACDRHTRLDSGFEWEPGND